MDAEAHLRSNVKQRRAWKRLASYMAGLTNYHPRFKGSARPQWVKDAIDRALGPSILD